MALGESAKVVWSNILYAPFINFAGGNVTGGYQVSQPLRGVWVQFVVVSRHVGFLAGGSGGTLLPKRSRIAAPNNVASVCSEEQRTGLFPIFLQAFDRITYQLAKRAPPETGDVRRDVLFEVKASAARFKRLYPAVPLTRMTFVLLATLNHSHALAATMLTTRRRRRD
jgi:hypothetical protein